MAFEVTVQAISRVFEDNRGTRSSTCRFPSSLIFHQTIFTPFRSKASHVATLASWSISVTTISFRLPIVCPTARLTKRMKDVAFMPKAISLASRAFTKSATLCRAREIVSSAFCVTAASLHVAFEQVVIHRVQHGLRNLRSGGVVEKNEFRSAMQGRKAGANGANGKVRFRWNFGTENASGLFLQNLCSWTLKSSAAVLLCRLRPTYTALHSSSRAHPRPSWDRMSSHFRGRNWADCARSRITPL